MKLQYVTFLLTCFLATTLYSAETPTNATNLILIELRGIRASLDHIAEELSLLRSDEEKRKTFHKSYANSTSFNEQGPDISKLSDLTLTEDASTEDVKNYIRDIVTASQEQNIFSDRDPQVAMLTSVGKKNLPALLDALTHLRSMHDYYIVCAIVKLADDSNKSLILDSLSINHDLVKAVIQQGWEKDAKDILITELKNTEPCLPIDWIKAVASLNDKESFPLLRNYFINGENSYWTYEAIKHLPIENMPEAVAEAWQKSGYDSGYNRVNMAIIAVKYGHLDALAVLIEYLVSGNSDDYLSTSEARFAVLQHTEFKGSNAELEQWFQDNRKLLQFDQKTKKFVINENVEQ